MDRVQFIENPESLNPVSAFVVHLQGIKTEEQLFRELSSKFEFPPYFGYNWNAVYDCLRDFHWIKQKKILLIHDDFPSLDQQALSIYLQVLRDAANDWSQTEEHTFEIVFPKP